MRPIHQRQTTPCTTYIYLYIYQSIYIFIAEADYPVYHAAAEAALGAQAEEARVRYVPVSQISTPPTLTTTSRPYGEIVNQVSTAQQ